MPSSSLSKSVENLPEAKKSWQIILTFEVLFEKKKIQAKSSCVENFFVPAHKGDLSKCMGV